MVWRGYSVIRSLRPGRSDRADTARATAAPVFGANRPRRVAPARPLPRWADRFRAVGSRAGATPRPAAPGRGSRSRRPLRAEGSRPRRRLRSSATPRGSSRPVRARGGSGASSAARRASPAPARSDPRRVVPWPSDTSLPVRRRHRGADARASGWQRPRLCRVARRVGSGRSGAEPRRRPPPTEPSPIG